MKDSDKKAIELLKLTERVIILKDNIHGVGNWSKNMLPKTIEGCRFYIQYCKENYNVIG